MNPDYEGRSALPDNLVAHPELEVITPENITQLKEVDQWGIGEVNDVYGKYFEGAFPARETVAVKGLPKNVNVEISMIAML